jgi:hypothetical protein
LDGAGAHALFSAREPTRREARVTKTERRKTLFSLKRLERIGKILAIVVAVLTIVTTVVTAAQWFFAPATRTPVIVVREFTPLPDHRGMLVRFSISNRATEPLYVDRIYFVQRQPAWAGAMAWIASTVRSVVLGLDDARVKAMRALEGVLDRISPDFRRPITKVPEQRGRVSVFGGGTPRVRMPVFEGERSRLEPNEQADYRLEVVLPKADGRIEQAIELEYEWSDGTQRRLLKQVS